MPEGRREGGLILALLICLYLAVQFFKYAFPIFVSLTIVCFIVTIVLAVTMGGETPTIIAALCFCLLLLLSIFAYGVGYGIEKTDIGKSLVDAGEVTYNAKEQLDKAEEEADNALKNATLEVIESVESLNENPMPTTDLARAIVENS